VLQTILVPLDGTPVSEAALPYAEALARRTCGTVVVMRTVQPTPTGGWGDPGTAYTRAVQEAEDYVETLGQGLIARGIRVDTAVPVGGASSWIRDEILLRHVDLVVMATHDRAGMNRLVHGSIAESVVAQAVAPVMLVRAAEGLRPAERVSQPHPVLVLPLDGSALAEAAAPIAARLATACGASLVLVGVVPTAGQLVAAEGGITTYVDADLEQMTAEATDYLAEIRTRLPAAMRIDTVVRHGSPGREIAEEAEERAAMAVVMATHGRTGLVRSLLGSVAGEVVHHGTSPVILIPSHVLRPAEAAPSAVAPAGA
jgi:nucleotide-binding universal stress UspA family protein